MKLKRCKRQLTVALIEMVALVEEEMVHADLAARAQDEVSQRLNEARLVVLLEGG